MVVTQTALDDYNVGVLYTLISDMEKKTAQSRVAKATTGIRKQVTDAFLEKDPKKLLDQLVGKRRATLAKKYDSYRYSQCILCSTILLQIQPYIQGQTEI